MLTIYGDLQSGNCYKIYLALNLLGQKFRWVEIEILNGDTQTAEFLNINPYGKIPVALLDSGELLCESNAILNFIADGTELLPTDTFLRAKILQWQFFEQYSHEPFIAVNRFIKKYLDLPQERVAEFEAKKVGGYKALDFLEGHLTNNIYLVNDRLSIADISLFAYTHVADEGGFDLSRYPAINRWIEKIKALPNFVGMDKKLSALHK